VGALLMSQCGLLRMSVWKKLAVGLLLVGLSALILGSLKYTSREEVFRVGNFRATTTRQRSIPAFRYAGVGFLIAGGALWALGSRRFDSQ